ncbi:MAG: hemagglutination domain protein [Jatrophihabitantaceae bacterium]|nr:hemagglutination domain protein [Jatrophihabitantaceae bacterium]
MKSVLARLCALISGRHGALAAWATELLEIAHGFHRDESRRSPSFDSTFTGTITLTTGELVIDGSLTITGPGSDKLAVSGNDESRVFFIGNSGATPPTVIIEGLTATHGRAADTKQDDGNGGAIYVTDSLTFSLLDAVVSDSAADDSGGGVYIDVDFSDGGTVTIADTTIERNTADRDGGGLAADGANLSLDNAVLTHNHAGNFGGGIYTQESVVSLTKSTVLKNESDQDGGGLYITDPSGPTTITGSVVSGNVAGFSSTNDTGGGMYFDGSSEVTKGAREALVITASQFTDNTTADQGGGLSVYNGTATVTGSLFAGNAAGSGGAISAWQGGFVTVMNSTVSGNTAAAGGAFSLTDADDEDDAPTGLAVTGSTVSGNKAKSGSVISTASDPTFGGGGGGEGLAQEQRRSAAKPQAIAAPTISTYSVTIVNTTISGNEDTTDGAIVLTDTIFTVDHATIAGNVSPAAAISLLDSFSSTTLTNSILWNTGVDVDIYAEDPAVSNSLIRRPGQTTLVGLGNLVGVDPKLGPLANNGGSTLTLLPLTGSPAINAGNAAVGVAPVLDQRGLPRVSGVGTDMGAVEVQLVLVAAGPVDAIRNDGESVSFTAAASGDPLITVQWQVSTDGGLSWADVAGATDPTLTFTALLEQNGLHFRAVFSNGAGSVTTNSALLTVLGLAKTGAEVNQALPLGAALVAMGAAMTAFARRRRTN